MKEDYAAATIATPTGVSCTFTIVHVHQSWGPDGGTAQESQGRCTQLVFRSKVYAQTLMQPDTMPKSYERHETVCPEGDNCCMTPLRCRMELQVEH